ncbi:MAG: hypothetical protein NC342_07175 [Pseudoflavonifractor sp.]|nr:hypothetical protein [Alloprevotella sp.]MCM1117300.1 hypothetical protein [Pseudoflavonifractor sp.]
MSELTVQWIAVVAVVALCIWRAVEWLRRTSSRRSGCNCGCSPRRSSRRDAACSDCPLSPSCSKSPREK